MCIHHYTHFSCGHCVPNLDRTVNSHCTQVQCLQFTYHDQPIVNQVLRRPAPDVGLPIPRACPAIVPAVPQGSVAHFQGLTARSTLPHPNHQCERNAYAGWSRFSDRYELDPFFVRATRALPRCRCGRRPHAHTPEAGCTNHGAGQGPRQGGGGGGYGPQDGHSRVVEPRRPGQHDPPSRNAWEDLRRAQIQPEPSATNSDRPDPSDPDVGSSTAAPPPRRPAENRPSVFQLARRFQDPTIIAPSPGGHLPNVQITFVYFGCGNGGYGCVHQRQGFSDLELQRSIEEEEHQMVCTGYSEQPLITPSLPSAHEQALIHAAIVGQTANGLANALGQMGLNTEEEDEDSEDDGEEDSEDGEGVDVDGAESAGAATQNGGGLQPFAIGAAGQRCASTSGVPNNHNDEDDGGVEIVVSGGGNGGGCGRRPFSR